MDFSISTDRLRAPALHPVGKTEKAARDFEAILVSALLDSLQKTFSGKDEDDGPAGTNEYGHMGTQALASAISAGRGFGIAQIIVRHLPDTKVPGAVTPGSPFKS